MKLNLFSFGKLKTPGLRQAADYYKRLAKPWVTLQEIELKPLPIPEKTPQTRNKIQVKEGLLLLDRMKTNPLSKGSIYFLLDEMGKLKPTCQWAQDFKHWEHQGISSLSFCIGSSLGFSEEVRQKAQEVISLGPQTLSHELARVVFFEQVYRAFSWIRGHPYHNEGS